MAQQELFRKEAIQSRRGQWLGSVHFAIPLSFLWLTLLAAALAVAVVVFMVFGHYTRYESVSGQLVPSAGLLGVRSPTRGTVARVFVHEGETVHHGDPLVEISSERDSAAFGPTQALISGELLAEAKRLQAELTDQQQSARQQAAGLRTKLGTLRLQRRQIDDQIALERRQVDSADAMLAKMRRLQTKGYVSALQIEQQDSTALQMQQQVGSLVRQRLDIRQQIAQTQQQLNQLPLDLVAQQDATRQVLSKNNQQLAQDDLQRDAVLRAPASGVVSTLLVKRGQSVSAEQPLLSVLPKGSTLQAQLLVPSSAIGFVHRGSKVVMRYQAFPYQEFGQQYGHVASVSRSALSNGEVTSLTGARAPQPLYRVLVVVNRQTIEAYGRANALRPGMAISADILLHRRSLWQMAFAPLSGLEQQMTRGGSRS